MYRSQSSVLFSPLYFMKNISTGQLHSAWASTGIFWDIQNIAISYCVLHRLDDKKKVHVILNLVLVLHKTKKHSYTHTLQRAMQTELTVKSFFPQSHGTFERRDISENTSFLYGLWNNLFFVFDNINDRGDCGVHRGGHCAMPPPLWSENFWATASLLIKKKLGNTEKDKFYHWNFTCRFNVVEHFRSSDFAIALWLHCCGRIS